MVSSNTFYPADTKTIFDTIQGMEGTHTTKQIQELLKQYGDDTLSYFHLQSNRSFFFSPTGTSFLSYTLIYKIAIVAADPIGAQEEIALLVSSFLTYCEMWGVKPLFIGINKRHLPLMKTLQLQTLKIGEEAILDITSFTRDHLKKKVRRAVRHIEHMHVDVFFYTPLTIPEGILFQVTQLSNAWLKKNGKKEKGFSMTLKRLPDKRDEDCQFAVAVENNAVIGFLCFMPVYQNHALSLDYSRRKDNTYNGLNEFLIIKSAEYYKTKGIKKLSLNFAVFSNMVETNYSLKKKVMRRFLKPIRKFYKVDGLREFNEKFVPEWHERYIAYTSLRHMPRYMLAILRTER